MAQDSAGHPIYFGETALVEIVEPIPLEKMPWQERLGWVTCRIMSNTPVGTPWCPEWHPGWHPVVT